MCYNIFYQKYHFFELKDFNMATYENRARIDGVPVPIQCIRMTPTLREETKFHYHDYTELLYGISGSATVRAGGESYTLTKGDLVVIPNHEPHDVTLPGENPEYIVIKFLPSVLLTPEETYSEYRYALMLLQNTARRQSFFSAEELADTNVDALIRHAMHEWDMRRMGFELSLRADTLNIFVNVLRKWYCDGDIEQLSVTRYQSELIQKAIDHIERHYFETTQQSTAEALGVSTSYLSRVFMKGMQRSFSSYVNEVKLREARRMLISTDKSITEIGEITGFSTSAYFIANFKAIYKLTPNSYRKLYRGDKSGGVSNF